MIPGNINTDLISGADEGGYQISRSLRFNSSDSAFCSRVFSTPTDAKIGTFSFWCKRSKLGSGAQTILQQDSNSVYLGFDNNLSGADTFGVYLHNNTTKQARVTSQVFRDPSSWYHFVLAIDTTQGTASERLKFYVNGSQITTFSTSNTVDQNINIFSSGTYRIGSYAGSAEFLGGYLADIHFIDGQALTPSSFAETNATTGQWVPKAYTGSYGTNGFQLKFADNSNNTATTLGKDTSGNGNNWTPNNLSVTAGAGNDSLVDTPTSYGTDTGAGGEVRGNYCTINPLQNPNGDTFTNGNLEVTTSVSNYGCHVSTIATPLAGKWYAEVTIGNGNGLYSEIGLVDSASLSGNPILSQVLGVAYSSWDGKYYKDMVSTSYGTAANLANGDVIGIAYDAGAGTVTFYKNGSSLGLISGVTARSYYFAAADYWSSQSAIYIWNFGQRAWTYPANASGFKALCDTNLPAPTIAKPSTVMDVKLYTGNGSTQTISGLGFSPDLVWIKKRSGSEWHCINDTVRGAELYLSSNTTNAESGANNVLTAFTSTGYTVGSQGIVNDNGFTFASWCWDAGTSTVTNTQGSITSQVRANASAGFSIVTYTGNATTGATVGHGLGVAPGFVIIKDRGAAFDWRVWTTSFGTGNALSLNSTAATSSNSPVMQAAPSSTVMSLLGSGYSVNNSGNTYVAYCFAPVAGYSSFGSYTGNGSADGPCVYTGFRPRWVMIKRSDAVGSWGVLDTARNTFNVSDKLLWANLSDAEGTYTIIDALSNGFKLRESTNGYNTSSGTYIYAAFAENPFQYARAR